MKLDLNVGGATRRVEIVADGPGRWRVSIDGIPIEADAHLLRPGVLSLLLDGRSYRVVLDTDLAAASSAEPALHLGAQRISWQAEDPRSFRRRHRRAGSDGPVTLKATMPGRVVRVLLDHGDPVAAHQSVIVIEAMKMQNELKSPKEGRVASIRVVPGDTVASGDVLAIIE